VTSAEEREEKARAELAAAGDVARLHAALELHAQLENLTTQAGSLATAVAEAQRTHAAATSTLEAARTLATAANGRLEAAKAAFRVAEAADQAMAVRTRLVAGHSCPVCERPVVTVPPIPEGAAVAAAIAEGEAARTALNAAEHQMAERDRAARERELALATAKDRQAQVAGRIAEARERLSGAEKPETLRQRLEVIRLAERELSAATERVRTARSAHRRAEAEANAAADRLGFAWRGFDQARDAVAEMRPPAAERDDLAASWNALAAWAGSQVTQRQQRREAVAEAVTSAGLAVRAVTERVRERFEHAGLPQPGTGEADPGRVASVALAEADSAHQRCVERRAQAERLRSRLRGAQREATLAKGLSWHLRANQFERWLLTEALDSLVDGASEILRELSAGQYDLGHDKGEFFVVDHYDAGLRRPVRTLSGGETFQASLSLALALSEQLAGLSTTTASLESIVLDEGFGTLDASTLDTVAATLENLAARGDRMVGVVTHVGPLAERIPVRFEVSRDARTARVERISC
jgi:exonuclease SbcC